MMRWSFGVIVAMLVPAGAAADLDYRGTNQLRVENYDVSGDDAATPYFNEGYQAFNTLQFDFTYENDRYSRWDGQFSMVGDDSEYRTQKSGFTPQLLSLNYENGKTAVPYRLRLGNQYADYSYRTLRTSFKGAQVEFQPRSDSSGMRQSFVLSAGVTDPKWRDREDDPGELGGAGWLMEHPVLGRLAVNYAWYHKPTTAFANERTQGTTSIAFQRPFELGDHRVDVEGELAHFSGDHRDIDGPGSGQDQSDNGYYLQLNGRSAGAFTWRARFEEYGLHFQPELASVAANRRSQEFHLGWRMGPGISWRGRVQHYEVGFDEINPEDITLYGISASGPLLAGLDDELSGSIDAFVQERDNRNDTIDASIDNLRINLSRRLGDNWSGRFGFFYVDNEQKVAESRSRTTQYNVDLSRRLNFRGIRGSVTAGIQYRETDSAADSDEYRPRVGLNLSRGRHSVQMNVGSLVQQRSGPNTFDNRTDNASVRYVYRRDRHRFNLDAELLSRDPDNRASTDSWRIAATWVYTFENVEQARRPAAPAARFTATGLTGNVSLLAQIPLNVMLAEVKSTLAQVESVPSPAQTGFGLAYDMRLVEDVDARQRLVVMERNDFVDTTAIIVDFDYGTGGDDARQTYERVEDALLRQLGPPDVEVAEGQFGPDWVSAVNGGELVRRMEWNSGDKIIRFGMPRRLDGLVRIEIQATSRIDEAAGTYWSLESIR